MPASSSTLSSSSATERFEIGRRGVGALDVHDDVGDVVESDVGRGSAAAARAPRRPARVALSSPAKKNQYAPPPISSSASAPAPPNRISLLPSSFLTKTCLGASPSARLRRLPYRHRQAPPAFPSSPRLCPSQSLQSEIRRTWLRTGSNRVRKTPYTEFLAGQGAQLRSALA